MQSRSEKKARCGRTVMVASATQLRFWPDQEALIESLKTAILGL
jgi:hypothetical protein